MDPREFQYVSLSTAGTKGHAFLGFLDGVEDCLVERGSTYDQWHEALRGVAGSSAGCIAGLVLVLGVDRGKREVLLDDLSHVQKHLNPDLSLLLRNYGWEDGSALRQMVRNILTVGGLSPESTLGDLTRLLRKEFVCACTDLNRASSTLLSGRDTPHIKVVDAVFASCCVPFVFTPPTIDGTLLVDGCLTDELPDVFDPAKTMFITMDRRVPAKPVNTWREFLAQIVRCSGTAQIPKFQRLQEAVPEHVFEIRYTDEVRNMPTVNVTQTAHDTYVIYRLGYLAVFERMRPSALEQAGGVTLGLVHHFQLSNATGSELPPTMDPSPTPPPSGGESPSSKSPAGSFETAAALSLSA